MGEVATGGVLPLAGDIVAASAALAGFLLVYLGGLATDYAGFTPLEKASVRGSFQSRAWFAALAIIFSLSACSTAALAKWQAWDFVAGISLLLFAITLFLSALSAALCPLPRTRHGTPRMKRRKRSGR
jgi:hypothetical protein